MGSNNQLPPCEHYVGARGASLGHETTTEPVLLDPVDLDDRLCRNIRHDRLGAVWPVDGDSVHLGEVAETDLRLWGAAGTEA